MYTPEQRREYQRKYYAENKDKILARQKNSRKSRVLSPEQAERRRKYMKKYLATRYQESKRLLYALKKECALCGYDTSPVALDLHHNFPEDKKHHENRFSVRALTCGEEMSRCVVLCANCHRVVDSPLPED